VGVGACPCSDDALLQAWKEGRTGYPFIDAIMTQLRTEGWIHHLARHAVSRLGHAYAERERAPGPS
jgi:deoxyribodipyrimidine photolyase